jgi:protein ImuA
MISKQKKYGLDSGTFENKIGTSMRANPSIAVAELHTWLERAHGGCRLQQPALPFGVPGLDVALPGGGLALGCLHEVIEAGPAAEYAATSGLFVAGILARLRGPVLWCLRWRDLFAPALSRVGLQPDRVIYCETCSDREVLPAMEEGLRHSSLAAVVGEVVRLPLTASRRLQLAAGESGVAAFVIRRWHNAAQRDLANEPTSAVTRWRVSPSPLEPGRFVGLPRARWRLELFRVRGGEPVTSSLEACDAQGCLAVPAPLADRPLAAEAGRRAAAG